MKADGPIKSFEQLMTLSPASRFGVFTYHCDNLGDHIQTLALLQHVIPRTMLLRDHLTPQTDLCLIANGWLTDGELPNKNDFRQIRYVGVHLAPHYRNVKSLSAMRDCGVIGCRDTATARFFSSQGISTYLAGCATLTFPTYAGKREGIYCVDVSDEVKEEAVRVYKDPIFVSHDLDHFELDEVDDDAMMEQYRKAYELLARYIKAELVITSRVHATLPSVAFGTPVIYVGVTSDVDDRVTVLDGLGVKALNGTQDLLSSKLRKPLPIDASPFRERYLGFLGQSLACVEN